MSDAPVKRRLALVVGLAASTTVLAVHVAPRVMIAEEAVIRIDARASHRSELDLYVNGQGRPPARQVLVAGPRRAYVFGGITEDITFLRIDPGKVAGEEVEICEVTIADGQGVVERFDGPLLARWGGVNLESPRVEDGCLRFRSATSAPILFTRQAIVLRRRGPRVLHDLLRARVEPSTVVGVMTGGFALLLLLGVFDPERRAHPVLAAVAVGGTVLLVRWIAASPRGHPAVDKAVGHAALLGFSSAGNAMATTLAMGLAAAAALAAHLATRRRRGAAGPTSAEAEAPPPRTGMSRMDAAALLVAGAIVASQVPDIGARLQDMARREFLPHWDHNNVTTWAYLSHQGCLPLRDFWYPYAGQYVFDWPAPWGILALAVYRAALFALAFATLYAVAGGALLPATIGALAFIEGEGAPFAGITRYLLSATVALAFIAIDRRETRVRATHVLFWAVCALALFVEPMQLVYAGCFMGAAVLLDAFERRRGWRTTTARPLLGVFAVPAVSLLAWLGWAAARGQWPGLVDFYLGLGDAAVASTLPTDIVEGVRHPFGTQFLITVAPPLLVALGLYDRLHSPEGRRAGEAMLALGIIGFIVFQKHAARAIDQQLVYVPFLGLLVYATLPARRVRPLSEYVLLGVVAGAYLGVMIESGQMEAWLRSVSGTPRRLVAGLATLTDAEQSREANAQRFAVERFARFVDERQAASRLRELLAGAGRPLVWVLSDDPVLYVLLHQRPPYQVNAYNASPIYEQHKVAEWARANRPDFLVWDPKNTVNDSVQAWVRVPLIYDAALEGYVFLERAGRFDILRRRHPDEGLAIEYWRDRMGPTVDLGHIPELSSFPRLRPCVPDGRTPCASFLSVEVTRPVTRAEQVIVPFRSGGADFDVLLSVVPDHRTYHVALDRLWFWSSVSRAGSAPVVAHDRLSPDVKVAVHRRAADGNVLY